MLCGTLERNINDIKIVQRPETKWSMYIHHSLKFFSFFCVQQACILICTYSRLPLSRSYHVHEQEKYRAYDEQICEVKRTCFSPLVFVATGGMGPAATTVYRKLASVLAEKWNISYSRCLFWVKCHLCFSLLRSGVICLRSHQSSKCCPVSAVNVDLAYSEGCLDAGALEWIIFRCWCHPTVQHLTASSGGGRQGRSI